MLNAVRAMATAAGLATASLNDRRFGDLARFAASMRRLSALEAAAVTMEANRLADMASLWVGGAKTLCRVKSSYAAGARFAGVVRFSTAPAAGATAGSAGARALWDRLKAAGFQVAEEGEAAATVSAATMTTSGRVGAAAVRVLKEAPARERRTVWTDDGARKAA